MKQIKKKKGLYVGINIYRVLFWPLGSARWYPCVYGDGDALMKTLSDLKEGEVFFARVLEVNLWIFWIQHFKPVTITQYLQLVGIYHRYDE